MYGCRHSKFLGQHVRINPLTRGRVVKLSDETASQAESVVETSI